MTRTIEPPRREFAALRTPLTAGELEVVDLFDKHLTSEWEMYIQPHLNGLRPDLVLLHPGVGVAVFEVKDWDLDAMSYRVADRGGSQCLVAIDKRGKQFSIPNPVSKLLLYQDEIASLYCPRLDARNGIAVISAGLVFTRLGRESVTRLLRPFRDCEPAICKYPQYFPLAGIEDVAAGNLAVLFPEHQRGSSKYMSEELAEDLRGWLREPDHSHQQREPLELDLRQRELASTRTTSGYRRMRGPAGTGKSLVLAARASAVAQEGGRVLVVTFNITLKNYLRDLAVRHGKGGPRALKSIDFLNFHSWCKRCCSEAGRDDDYSKLWKTPCGPAEGGDESDSDQRDVLNERLAALVSTVFASCEEDRVPTRYDAIIVDEGQDFRLSWWNVLRRALKPGGEMVLAADRTQDIYETAAAWTEDAMTGSGFSGPWAELKVCYRIPTPLIDLVGKFATEFMAGKDVDVPVVMGREQQLELGDEKTRLRWVHVSRPDQLPAACVAEVTEMMKRLTGTSAVSDIVILAPTQHLGLAVSEPLSRDLGVKVHHTFDHDKRVARKRKLSFFKGDARVKATTLHSFKGWETRHLIVVVDTIDRPDSAALLFTAMTRLRRDPAGSCLTVVSSCPSLRSFGEAWPEFAEC